MSTHNHYHPAHRTRDKDNELDDSGCVLTVAGLRGGREKTHGSSPSTSGKTNEKPSEIQTRRRQCTIDDRRERIPWEGEFTIR